MSVGISEKSNADGINFVAPDGGWGWIIVISSLLIHVIMDGITYALGQYLTVFVDELEVQYAAASVVHSLLPAVTLSCGPIGSALTNRYGCRNTTIIGTLIATIGFILSCLFKNLYFLYFSIGIVVGIGFGLIYVPAIVCVGYYFEKRRSLAMGIAVCGAGIGTALFAPLNRFLLDMYGWQGAFLIKAGIVLNLILCAVVMRPVPIEPSEILKRKKKLEKSIQDKEDITLKVIDKSYSKDTEKNNSDTKNALLPTSKDSNYIRKLGESMPSALNKADDESTENTKTKDENGQFHKSLQSLADDKKAKTYEEALLQSYSSLNVLAHMRSLKNITDHMHEDESQAKSNMSEVKKIIISSQNVNAPANNKNSTFNLSVLRNILFITFAISNFFTSLGFNAPYIFVNDQAISYGMSKSQADMILQAIGLSNTIGRVVLGFVSDLKIVNRLYLYSTVITLCGIATLIEPFLKTFPLMILYGITFGITSGGYVSLTALLLVDLLGLENLSNAFGILLVFQGIATAIGPPITGGLKDFFKSYTIPFMFLGTVITVSGLICYFIPCFKSYKKPGGKEEAENTA